MKFKLTNRFTFFIVLIAAILLSGLSQVWAQTSKTTKISSKIETVTNKERKSIERIIREYLLANPSVIRDAMQALQIKEEKEKQQRAAESMKRLKSDIYLDPDSPSSGNAKADVPIVVFFDYNCGHCKNTMPALQGLLLEDPSLRIIYKEFPILGPSSQLAALAALAAKRQGKYSEFHHALMVSSEINTEVIKGISDSLKINYTTLQKDMSDPKLNEALNRNLRLASSLGINGTPAYIVGNQIIPGAIDSESLKRIVQAERANSEKVKSRNKNLGAMK